MSVAILESSVLLRDALAAALTVEGLHVSLHDEPAAFLAELEGGQVDAALIDLSTLANSLRVLQLAHLRSPGTRLVVLRDGDAGPAVDQLVALGITSALDRGTAPLRSLVDGLIGAAGGLRFFPGEALNLHPPAAHQDAFHLSVREHEVLGYVTAGYDNLKISAVLGIGERTVKAHVSALYRKLQMENRTQLALAGLELGAAPAKAS